MRGKKKIQSLLRRALGCSSLEDYSSRERRAMWPSVRRLEKEHFQNCVMVADRYELLNHMPKNGVCIELGILNCEFSEKIIESTTPKKLYLVDITRNAIDIAESKFSHQIRGGEVVAVQGDSAEVVMAMQDASLNWAYVDANHDYEFVKNDLNALRTKIKPGDVITMNDYTFFAPSAFQKFGVMEAVNEFCIVHNWELVFWALHGRGYYDVSIREFQ